MSSQSPFNRRHFIRNSALGLAGAGLLSQGGSMSAQQAQPKTPAAAPAPVKISEYRTLGRTGFKASDISSGGTTPPAVLRALIDAGVNYIDTAESYSNGQSELNIGEAIKGYDRSKLFITSKIVVKEEDTRDTLIARVNKCLERLGSPYVDCMMNHSCQTAKQVKSEIYHEAMKQLKSEGKIRFTGISNHGNVFGSSPESMETVLLAAVEDGRFDVMLLVYNFVQQEMGEKILKACNEKNIGATLMKTKPLEKYLLMKERMESRAKQEGKELTQEQKDMLSSFKDRADKAEIFMKEKNITDPREIRDASVRFVLQNKHVATACIAFQTFEDVEGYLKLSGSALTAQDKSKLSLFREHCSPFYCRHACGACESACPHGVPVNTIMRFNHYFEMQGREKEAMTEYARLSKKAWSNTCDNCSGLCHKACPYGVEIYGLLRHAHENLTLA